jgi:hypothetical protein
MDTLVIAPSVVTRATAAEVAEEEDTGRTETLIRAGVIGLVRITGRANHVRPPGETSLVRVPGVISLVRVLGVISLVRTGRKATLTFLCCHHRQEGMKIDTKMMGLGASKNLVPSLASWAVHRPQRLIASSSSLLVR